MVIAPNNRRGFTLLELLLVLALLATRPESISAYGSPAGGLVLGVGGAACLLAYRLMVRIGRLPAERRVLR